MASLVSIDDLTDADLHAIVERGVAYASGRAGEGQPLTGKVVGIYFRMTSTRTRTAFSSGALRLGGRIVTFGPDDLQTNTGESVADTGGVLGRMLDAVVCRTGRPQRELADWAALRTMSVVNAMTAEEHPTQALADLTTLWHRFGELSGLRVLYVGEGNNTAAALARAMPRFGIELDLRTPPGYGLDAAVAALSPSVERHDMDDLPRDVDVVYTTRWQTTGTSKPDPLWRQVFEPFQVTEQLMKANPDAVFMHDLPAHRGDEVTAEVIDGLASIVFEQAEHKMHSAMAVLEWCCR
jgi:ornithine carbamoyltransferase